MANQRLGSSNGYRIAKSFEAALSGTKWRCRSILRYSSPQMNTIAGEIVTLPSVTEPDAAQSVILNRRGLNLPRCLRRLDELAQVS